MNKKKTKVDLITGFLGAGKTTFIKKYGKYLKKNHVSFTVIENEYGGPGIDRLALSEMNIETKELAGGCMCCTLKVGFHDMLVELAHEGAERIVVEPSGIYEVNQFLSIMSGKAVRDCCEIGMILCIVNPMQMAVYNEEETEFLKHQLQFAGGVILSRTQYINSEELEACLGRLRKIAPDTPVIYQKEWEHLSDADFDCFLGTAYNRREYESDTDHAEYFQNFTLFPEATYEKEQLEAILNKIVSGDYGNIMRVKGTAKSCRGVFTVNMVPGEIIIEESRYDNEPQINIIGSDLKKEALAYLM